MREGGNKKHLKKVNVGDEKNTRYKNMKNIAGKIIFLSSEINLFFQNVFLSPEINCFFLNRQESKER